MTYFETLELWLTLEMNADDARANATYAGFRAFPATQEGWARVADENARDADKVRSWLPRVAP